MADGVFNIAKGRVNQYMSKIDSNDPADSGLTIVLLKVVEADASLDAHEDLAAIIADAGNDEADFANYDRKDITDANVADPTPDHGNNWQTADFENQTWLAATTGQSIVKLIVCYNPALTTDVDANIIPLTYHDFVADTDGNDLIAQVDAAGFYKAA